jgi:hypothetical protein
MVDCRIDSRSAREPAAPWRRLRKRLWITLKLKLIQSELCYGKTGYGDAILASAIRDLDTLRKRGAL